MIHTCKNRGIKMLPGTEEKLKEKGIDAMKSFSAIISS